MKFIKKIAKNTRGFFYLNFIPLFKRRINVECPCCGWKGSSFISTKTEFKICHFIFRKSLNRINSKCPKCDSFERHRLYYLYLQNKIPKNKKIRILHFAPEKILTNFFKFYNNIEYLSADIDSKKAMTKENIINISHKNNTFDIVFCSHVLEHIEDDIKAMKEIYRILKPKGFAILQVPIKRKNTFEDFSIKSPKEREKVFGQKDHVRIYGEDYKDRLKKAGFKLKIEKFVDSLDKKQVKRFVLLPNNGKCHNTEGYIYLCRK